MMGVGVPYGVLPYGGRPTPCCPLPPQVQDAGGQALGALSLPLSQLLAAEALTLDTWLPLSGGGQVLLRAQLGVSAHLWGAGGVGLDPPSPSLSFIPPPSPDPGVAALGGGTQQ